MLEPIASFLRITSHRTYEVTRQVLALILGYRPAQGKTGSSQVGMARIIESLLVLASHSNLERLTNAVHLALASMQTYSRDCITQPLV